MNLKIKTEKEFIEEYGEDWRENVPCQFTNEMDELLGMVIKCEDNAFMRNFDDLSDSYNFTFWYEGHGYMISKGMVKPYFIGYNKPKKLVYESKIMTFEKFNKI